MTTNPHFATALGLATGGVLAYIITRDFGATAAGVIGALLIVTVVRAVVEKVSP